MRAAWVDEKLWRGEEPSTMREIRELKELGITRIICLQGNALEMIKDSFVFECEMWGDEFCYFPMSSFFPPRWELCRVVLKKIQAGGKTYIHCQEGVDRTGFVCALYLIATGQSNFTRAVKEMFSYGFHWWYSYWIPFLWIYARRLK